MLENFPPAGSDYEVIYADCPWQYRDKSRAGKRGVAFKYPTMTLDEIKSLPVREIAADDSVLFLWVTWPQLAEGLDTMKAWGFEYKTIGFVWIKLRRRLDKLFSRVVKAVQHWKGFKDEMLIQSDILSRMMESSLFLGMGNWTRSNSEICLMGVHGKPKRAYAGVRSVVLSPIREHSQKPDEVRGRIEDLLGDVRRVELFARTRTPGWDVWGNDVDKFSREEIHE